MADRLTIVLANRPCENEKRILFVTWKWWGR
eukprot:SAG31_NODE_29881_length_388_cov_1.249135_1_plen_30_part_01